MIKKTIETIYEKNAIIKSIFTAIESRNHFLILGHQIPDEDCVSSMVAIALLITKFNKEDVKLYFSGPIHANFHYLLSICKYNSIKLLYSDEFKNEDIDTIIFCDTPKPSMIDAAPGIKSMFSNDNILLIEIDHHIGADSEYIGEEGYRLVTNASSACELIGLLALKLRNRKDLLQKYNITEPITRNLVLSIISGMIGDTKMGKYLKSKNEKKYYDIFSAMFNNILHRETVKESNFSDQSQVFDELERLSNNQETCYNYMIRNKRFSQSIGFVILSQNEINSLSCDCDNDTIVSVTRAIADALAEESGKIGLVAYYDDPAISDLVQFRLRRGKNFKTYDLRKFISIFSIENGGGHEGAIAFRITKDKISNLENYVHDLIIGIEREIP